MSNIIHPTENIVNSNGLKIIFMGTPEFSVPILEKLANSDYKPVAVFCAPDKPVGRRQILTPPPIKLIATGYDIPTYQPSDVSSFKLQVLSLNPDLIITAAYGLIFPKEVLNAPPYGCLNIHPSLLPKYRGPSPIQTAILNGDIETGVTIYKMDTQIDHGPILITDHLSLITKKYATPELSQTLSILGADLLLKILPDWLAEKITPTPQDESKATYTKIITKEDGRINWQKSAQEIERQIRAYDPWPGAYALLTDYRLPTTAKLKILAADILKKNYGKQLGEVFLTDANALAIQAGGGALIIKKLQLEGSQPLSTQDFLRGHKDVIGKILK